VWLLCCRFSFHLSCAPSKHLEKNEAAYTITPFINCRVRRAGCKGDQLNLQPVAAWCVRLVGHCLNQAGSSTHPAAPERAETKFNLMLRSERFCLFVFSREPHFQSKTL
jgi:hypothetical protein